MKQIIDVFTGEVKSSDSSCDLVSRSIGSCIVVTAFVPAKIFGSMAHIMLPGKSPEKCRIERTKYAVDAINELLRQLNLPETLYPDIKICLVGAGNVLKRKDDLICSNNINSVQKILADKGLKIKAQVLGGTKRRSVRFDVAKSEVYYSEDSSREILLWKNNE